MRSLCILIAIVFLLSSCPAKNTQSTKGISGMPPCLVTKIQNIISDPKQSPPQSVTQFSYNGKAVFYVMQACCDQYNQVYDSDCNYLGAPDGGIAGKGDGRLSDFSSVAKDKKVVWENGK